MSRASGVVARAIACPMYALRSRIVDTTIVPRISSLREK